MTLAVTVGPIRRRILDLRAQWQLAPWLTLTLWVFAVLLLVGTLGTAAVHQNDTATYLRLRFIGVRLWTVPLFFALLHSDAPRIAGQSVLAVCAWLAITVEVTACLRNRRLKALVGVFFASIGLCPAVTQWNRELLSESSFISLCLLFAAALIHFLRAPSWRRGCLTFSAAFCLTFCRQAVVGVMLLAGVAMVAGALTLVRRSRRPMAVLGLGMIAVSVAAGYISFAGSSQIQAYNFGAIAENRVMTSGSMKTFFVARGMPLTPTVRKDAGDFVANWQQVLADPIFRPWLDHDFRSVYAAYLESHPFAVVSAAVTQMPALMTSLAGEPPQARPLPTDWLTKALWTDRSLLYLLVSAAAVTGVAAAATGDGRWRAHQAVAAGIAVASLLYYSECWVLSATELPRLSDPAAVMLRVALLVLTISSIDVLLSRPKPPVR